MDWPGASSAVPSTAASHADLTRRERSGVPGTPHLTRSAGLWLAIASTVSPDPHAQQEPLPEPAADNIRTIVELEQRSNQERPWQERLSERISQFAGSLAFVAIHLGWFVCWAAWNALAPDNLRFDPYPYGLLTFIVSLEAVLVSTFVLIAQNRMSRQSDHRHHLNLQVDLLAEQEITLVLRMLRRITEHLRVPEDENAQNRRAEELTEETNVYELMRTLERELPESKK
jgi:uncharacterized membrane protein